MWKLLAVLSVIMWATPALGQIGGVNLPGGFAKFPAFPPPTSPASPVTDVTMPWVGIDGSQAAMGQVLRQVWVEPQIVPILTYIPVPQGIPERWDTSYVEVPGYWVTETTKGTVFPTRWALENPGLGVYRWRPLPGYFQPR